MPSLKSRLKKVQGKIQQREALRVAVSDLSYEKLRTMEPAELVRLHYDLLHTAPGTALTAEQRQQQREYQEQLAKLSYHDIVLLQCNAYRQIEGLSQRADVFNNHDCVECPCARWCSSQPSHVRAFAAAQGTAR